MVKEERMRKKEKKQEGTDERKAMETTRGKNWQEGQNGVGREINDDMRMKACLVILVGKGRSDIMEARM